MNPAESLIFVQLKKIIPSVTKVHLNEKKMLCQIYIDRENNQWDINHKMSFTYLRSYTFMSDEMHEEVMNIVERGIKMAGETEVYPPNQISFKLFFE